MARRRKKNRRKDRRYRRPRRLLGESLESRNLRASVSLVGGELQIMGATDPDHVEVWTDSSSVYVDSDGQETAQFSRQDVNSIYFSGLAGDDVFKNKTKLPATAYGDDGSDTLHGGSSGDVLYGGIGNDSIFAGGGDDYVKAGDEDDTVKGGDGNDTLYGGEHNDVLYGGTGDDSILGLGGHD
jgi:Ca2+-binding RTX toxin-like protein